MRTFSTNGASALTVLASAGTGLKHRIFKITLTADDFICRAFGFERFE